MKEIVQVLMLQAESDAELWAVSDVSRDQARFQKAHILSLQTTLTALSYGTDVSEHCSVCSGNFKWPVVTSCCHIFCRQCAQKSCLFKETHGQTMCPICDAPLKMSELIELAPQNVSTRDKWMQLSDATVDPGTKINALLMDLKKRQAQLGNTTQPFKVVVFSQWGRFLDLIEAAMTRAEFSSCRLKETEDSSSPMLQHFRQTDQPTALLMNLRKGTAAGMNLTEACVVYLMEPHLSPAVEDQAVGRIHRIGQTQETTCVRLVTRDTVEHHIINMRESKRDCGIDVNMSNLTVSERTYEVLLTNAQ